MFYVDAQFFETFNRGTASEYRKLSDPKPSGPFHTREGAESFARGISSQPSLGRVVIREEEEQQ